jgi:Domain of unknown function (DUF4158)
MSSGNATPILSPSPDQLARDFYLDRRDREIADRLRGDRNGLGFALILGPVRFLGAFSDADLEISQPVAGFLITVTSLV